MSNLVIVAIPDENDRVWKISSEKVPHLTLLFLGEMGQVANVQKIIDFVEHAANTSLSRFYLPVDRRGELGDDPQKGPADVLFFKKTRYDFKAIRDFRAALLQDNNIKTAYDAAPQFEGPWTPHLTLGYQTTPAKEDKEDFPFYDVSFNKIAVWTGDYEGPEFLLKDYWDDFELVDMPMDVAMSSMNDARRAAGLEALEHHGVKGMKWGVRKAKDTTVTVNGKTKQVTAKKAAKLDKQWEQKVGSTKTFVELHNKGAEHVNARIAQFNADFEKKHPKEMNDGTLWNHLHPVTKEYYSSYNKMFEAGLNKAAADMGTNPTGTRKVHIISENHDSIEEFGWAPATTKVTHAATDLGDGDLVFVATRDKNGLITKVTPFKMPDSLAQSVLYGETFVEGVLEGDVVHYGVKGMRWGHRKAEPSAVAPHATSRVPAGDKRKTKIDVQGGQNHPAHPDAIKVAQARVKLAKSGPAALSNQELRDVATRIQLETQVKTLTRSSGHKFVRNLLGKQGNEAANQAVRQQVRKHAFS